MRDIDDGPLYARLRNGSVGHLFNLSFYCLKQGIAIVAAGKRTDQGKRVFD